MSPLIWCAEKILSKLLWRSRINASKEPLHHYYNVCVSLYESYDKSSALSRYDRDCQDFSFNRTDPTCEAVLGFLLLIQPVNITIVSGYISNFQFPIIAGFFMLYLAH